MTRISKLISKIHPVRLTIHSFVAYAKFERQPFWFRRTDQATWAGKITVALALSTSMLGCMGNGYSIPGFSSKQSTKADAIETEANAPLEQPILGKSELAHIASHEVNLGASSEAGLAKISFLDNEQRQQELVNISNSSSEKQTGSEIDAAFLIQEKINQQAPERPVDEIRNYEGLISSVDGGESNLDALRRSPQELNESAEQIQESSVVEIDTTRVQDSLIQPVMNEAEELTLESTSVESVSTGDDFPWANAAANTTAPVVNRVKGILNKATTLTQEGGRISSQAVTSTARTVIEKTQSVFTPEHVTAEEVLAEMKTRQDSRQSLSQQTPVITPSPNNQSNVTAYADSSGPAPVVIDLSREWVNAPEKSKRNVDSIAQFANSTVVANQPAQLPVITPGRSNSLYESNTNPVKPKPVPAQTQRVSAPVQNEVVQLGNVAVEGVASHRMVVGKMEAEESNSAFVSQSAPMIILDSSESDAAPFEGNSSAPILLAPGLGSAESAQDEEFDEFAAAFADVTESGGPEIAESPLLIDETELSLKPKSSSRFSATHITMTCCGIAFLAMMLIRWRR